MKNNYLHTGNTTKKSSPRAKPVFRAFGVAAVITLAGVALVAGPEHLSAGSNKSQERSGKNPIAEKYNTLVMRVYFRDRDERDRLAQELNAEEVPTTGGYLTVINDRDVYYDLLARGLRVEIDENSSRNLSDPQILRETFYGGYKSVEEIYAFLDQKVAQFPDLVEKVDIGDSWCKSHPGACVLPSPWNGYDLFVLHITNRNIPGPKPVFWADGDIHAREIATPEVVMRMIDHLLDNYDTNADVHWLVDYHDIWLMPEVNPDGHHIVEAGGNSPYYYRKNGDNVGGGGCSWPPDPSNHTGIDNNRNFPFKWGCCGGSSGLVCEQTYRGTSAGSEPEDTAIVNKIRTLVADQRGPNDTDAAPITATGVYQNIHTVVPVNLFPWGWSSTHMPNYNETRNIAAHMAAPNAGGNGYPFGSIIDQLYPVDGGSIDWAYGELGMAAFSTELSGQDFLPSYSCIDNPGCGSSQGIWPENRGMLLYLAKIARTPYLLSHGPDANTVVTNPAVVPPGVSSQLTASINFAWSSNSFNQNVGAAEYYIDTPPWAGGTAIPMSGGFTSPTVAVNATIDAAGLSLGRHVIFVRGRGVTDFQGLQTWGPISAAFLDVSEGGPTPTPSVSPTPTSTSTPATSPTPTPSCTPLLFTASLDGSQEVPPSGSTATGSGTATLDVGETMITVNLSFAGLTSNAIAAHIHAPAPPGMNAPVVIPFTNFPATTSGTYSNTFAITPTQVSQLRGGLCYFNIHTSTFSGGEIRGQLTGICSTPTPSPTPPLGTPSPTPTPTPITPTPTPSPVPPAQSLNLSTRMQVQIGDNVGIGGFIITGSAPRQVLLRAIGPSLSPGVSDALADPVMELHGPAGFQTMTNDNWRDTQEAEIKATGIAPTNDAESAIVATLDPGAYTAIVSGKNNSSGVGLVEVYNLDQSAASTLANISTRAFVGTQEHVLIGGFILGGGDVAYMVIRALSPPGVPATLADPTLELRDSNGVLLDANDDCAFSQIPPPNVTDACIERYFNSGAYTAIVAGKNGATGVGLVEVYNLGGGPSPTPITAPFTKSK